MSGKKREARLRVRCPGYPRLPVPEYQDVDGRDKPGHDGGYWRDNCWTAPSKHPSTKRPPAMKAGGLSWFAFWWRRSVGGSASTDRVSMSPSCIALTACPPRC